MKKIMSLVFLILAVNLLMIVAQAGSVFADVDDGASYAAAVQMAKDLGLLKGDDKGNFNPAASVTRAEFATVLFRMFSGESTPPSSYSSAFDDLPTNYWAAPYIAWAVDCGMINGYGARKFGPNDPVTYDQALKMLLCACGYSEDAEDIGGYPYGYMSMAERTGFSSGINAVIKVPVPRSDVATMIKNVYTSQGGGD